MAKITMIPATMNPITRMPSTVIRKKRVAGYARVSTDSEEQFTSYEAQIDYYTQYILGHSDWEFVKVYTDEGISGTNIKKREGFNNMINDALAGKIDLIVTKSVSRFARNTVDSLVTVRRLKEKGVEVYFEKENIYTLDSKGELLITIMSSLAQEESRSLSENVTWGQRKAFSDGKLRLPYSRFLGYCKGSDGLPQIVPEQAEIVKRIYQLFIGGMTTFAIAKQLTAEGILTPGGKQNWQASTVESIIRNEKYKGDALLQKEFTVDFLTKTKKKNEGEVPQYYVENSHPAIVTPEEWDAAQKELERRKVLGRKYSGTGIFATRLVCADCGEYFGAKTWHSNNKYRKIVWRCTHKYIGEERCQTPNLSEENIKQRFLTAINVVYHNRESILDDCRTIQTVASDCTAIDTEITSLLQEMEVVSELTRRCVEENSRTAQDQTEFESRYNGFVTRYETASTRLQELRKKRQELDTTYTEIGGFMFEITEMQEPVQEFDEALWRATIDRVLVKTDGALIFRFRGGIEIAA